MISEDIKIPKLPLKHVKSDTSRNMRRIIPFLSKLGLVLFRFEDSGPTPYLETSLPTLDPRWTSEVIKKASVIYLCALGQGDAYHTGFFGPVPVPGASHLNALLYAFIKADSTIIDRRADHKSYLVLGIFFPREDRNSFLQAFYLVKEQLNQYLTSFSSIQDIPADFLQTIFKTIVDLTF